MRVVSEDDRYTHDKGMAIEHMQLNASRYYVTGIKLFNVETTTILQTLS